MAMAVPASGWSLPAEPVFPLRGRQLITMYLGPNATRGKLSNANLPGGCSVTAGVDVFAASPDELPYEPSHRRPNGEVWGYFSAADMAESVQPAPGGCWAVYGKEKGYELGSETFGYRRRFAFHVTRVEPDGTVMWAKTRWMMKEYRLNKDAAMIRQKKLEFPEANQDFVIRKFFTKPWPPPARTGGAIPGVGARIPSSGSRPTKVPAKASAFAVRKDSTKNKTKTKTKTKKVVPPPLPPCARQGQQEGTSLPPCSARPPLPPKVVTKPVALPNPAQVIATPPLPQPPQDIATRVVPPPPPPKVIATPPPPARSSQDEAALRSPGVPNASMELVVYRGPATAKPLSVAPLRAAPPGPIAAGRTMKVSSGYWIINQYLGPKAVGCRPQFPSGVVAEGVDVFAVSPDSLACPPMRRNQNGGQVWGYFLAATPTTGVRAALGGCWMQYGPEKRYCVPRGHPCAGEVFAFRRRWAFQAALVGGDGKVVFEHTRWLMKEYRLNKVIPAVFNVRKGPGANMDAVVLKVFTMPVAPPPPPPCAKGECGVALQQGGTSLPPCSARPPLPPKVVTKPVAVPNPAQVIATPPLPQPPQAIVVPPPPPPKVTATPPPPARSSQDEAALRSHGDRNASMELRDSGGPATAKPLSVAPLRAAPPRGYWLKVPSGYWIIDQYLGPKAIGGRPQIPSGVVAEGVDVFAVSPDSLPCPPMRRNQNGQVRGYFFAATPTTSVRAALGGCWMQYGPEKRYRVPGGLRAACSGEIAAFRRRWAFQAARVGGDGKVVFEQTPWLMKEYRLNKDAPSVIKMRKGPGANMDAVVLKVFAMPVAPPPPASFSESEYPRPNYILID